MSSADRGEAAFGIAPPEPSQAPPVDPDETIFIAQPQPQMTDADAEQHYGQRQSVLRRRKTEASGDDPVVLPPIEKQSNRTVAQAGAAATSDASAHRLLGALLDSSSTREFGSSFRFLLEDLNPLNPLSASSAGGSNKVHVRIPQARSDRPSTAGSSGRDGPPIDASRDDSKERRAMADDEPSLSASRSPSPSKKALQLAEFRKKAEDVSAGLKSLRQRNADPQQLRSFIADSGLAAGIAQIALVESSDVYVRSPSPPLHAPSSLAATTIYSNTGETLASRVSMSNAVDAGASAAFAASGSDPFAMASAGWGAGTGTSGAADSGVAPAKLRRATTELPDAASGKSANKSKSSATPVPSLARSKSTAPESPSLTAASAPAPQQGATLLVFEPAGMESPTLSSKGMASPTLSSKGAATLERRGSTQSFASMSTAVSATSKSVAGSQLDDEVVTFKGRAGKEDQGKEDAAAEEKKALKFGKELEGLIKTAINTKKLDLSERNLPELPKEVYSCTGLRQLWFHCNKLKRIPSDLIAMRTIMQLRLYDNELTCLPENIGDLSVLQVLWLQNNKISSIPLSIGNCVDLRILSLYGNPINALPITLIKCVEMKELQVDYSNISVPPFSIVQKGVNPIMIYLKEYSRRLDWGKETQALDMSGMKLASNTLPYEITDLTSLTSLKLARNTITGIAAAIYNMASLTELDVSDNPTLTALSTEVGLMSQLRVLCVDNVPLTCPPPSICAQGAQSMVKYLHKLHLAKDSLSLDLNSSRITDIDPLLCSITTLTSLDAHYNELETVRPEIGQLVRLTYLDLSGNALQQLPTECVYLTSLTEVNISSNLLVHVGSYVSGWIKVHTLNLLNNPSLGKLPMHMGNMTSLTKLDIDIPKFHRPPVDVLKHGARVTVQYCSKFRAGPDTKSLLISRLQLRMLPMEVTRLPNLVVLDVQHNEMRILPQEIEVLQRLEEIILNQNPLGAIPPILANISSLSVIRADNCILTQFPAWAPSLLHISIFSVTHNRITELPETIGRCERLTRLNLDNNNLRSLPDTIGSCSLLDELTITKNTLLSVPETIGQLALLSDLRLSHNRLASLPEALGKCTSLTRLRCPFNMIAELPYTLRNLTRMVDLSVQNNSITFIPLYIGTYRMIKNFTFESNPLQSPSQIILDKGAAFVLKYLLHLGTSYTSGSLDLSYSGITLFPLELVQLTQLRTLILDGNSISEIPAAASTLVNLNTFSIVNCGCKRIHHKNGSWSRLLNVNVSGNDLRTVPLGWGASSSLKTLSMSDNNDDLWVFPPPEVVKQRDIACIRYCQGWANGNIAGRLEQEGMSMKSFPLCNLWLQKLKYLSVARNNITALPEAFDAVSYPVLECLVLTNNELPCMPTNFSTLTTLTSLSIENNAFSIFPVVIVMFTSLRSLKLAGNLFQHIDARMGRATGLTELTLDHHKIIEPPQEVAELGCETILRYWSAVIAARKWGQGSWAADDFGQLGKAATGGALVCTGMKLKGFPPEARDFINLLHIDLQRNKMPSVPSELLVFRNVHALDLSWNVIEVVSSVLGNLIFLELLDLSHNKIVELPTLIGNLGYLKVLRVNHNRLVQPPHSFGRLLNLTELDISNNKFESVFNGSGNLKKLQTFRCASNKIAFLPYELSETRATLTAFDFSGNAIDFPGLETQQQPLDIMLQYLHRFHSATTSGSLDISGFGLFYVPPSCFTLMTMITELDISRNYIEDLHPDIKALQQLRKIDFHSNNMTSLPLELCLLPSLETIITYDNELLSPPPEIIERGALHIMEYLKRYMIVRRGSALDLGSLCLAGTPIEVCFISALLSLSLANNGLSFLSAGLGQLQQLTELDASTNKLVVLPQTLWKITSLHRLNLSFNQLTEVGSGVSRLLQLRELLFDHNNIAAIQPEHFLPLQHLHIGRLSMSFNSILMPSDEVQCLSTPAQIRYLQNWATARQTGALDLSSCTLLSFPVNHVPDTPNLTRLDLSKNRLTSLPLEVSYLTKLLSLNIRDNNISRLDPCIGGLVAMTELLYEGNPALTFPPQGTLSLGAQKVSFFLRSFLHLPTTGVLELSDSLLQVVPPEAMMTTQVLALTLSKNQITELPSDFLHSIESLQTLVLDFNQLTQVPSVVSTLKQLRVFSARGNKITSVHGGICDCPFMRSINLADNDIVDVPWEIGSLQCLEILELKGNPRIDMPPLEIIQTQGSRGALQYLVRLCQLRINSLCDLSSMDLSEPTLPATVLAQSYLAGLSLSQNKLTTLDDTVALLSNSLVNLFLDDNRMETIPSVISKLTRLKTLSMAGNLLSDVPQWMETMTALTDISLANNTGLRYIPYYMSQCTNIVRLDLAGLDLLSPPIEVVRVGTDAIMRYVMAVATAFTSDGNFTCNYMELLQVDPQILRNPALVKINMAQNCIKAIDPRIGSLERLTDIDLSFNKIGTLPAEMYNLDRLERLILSNNRLTKIGSWFDDIQPPSRPYTHVITAEQQRELDKRAAQDALAATSSGGGESTPDAASSDAAGEAVQGNTVLAPNAALGLFPDDHLAAPPKFHFPWPALKHLDLSKNDFSELSETFGYLTRLETLNLGRNKLSALTVALALLTRLKELELEINPLTSPPMEIVSRGHEMVLLYLKRFDYIPGLDFTLSLPTLNLNQLPSDLRLYATVLTSLDISNNCLETLQANVSVLHRLRELKATSNVISTLPDEIGALLSLQRLYLQVNRLTKLPAAISLLRSLQLLNVVENNLTALGPEIGGLTALQELRVSRNAIVSIDTSIWKCKCLQILYVDANCLVELPQSLCRLPLLSSLHLANNRIERLPHRLGDLTSLTELDVADNCLEIFPPSLGQIAKNIQVLVCKGNPLSFVPPEIGCDRPTVLLGYLRALDDGFATGSLSFIEYGFSCIPPFVFTMTALTELKMSKNRLRVIDDDIAVLACLKLLDVSDNFLRALPLCLHSMPKLTHIITGLPHQNQFEDPPAPVLAQGTPVIINYLRALDAAVQSNELIIAGLRLVEFPKACLEMLSLTSVDISSNDLTEIPYEIECMRKLERLNCSSNNIVQVSSSISKLPRLTYLDLRSNRLHQLPQSVKDCEMLSSLLLDRNSFSSIPSTMLMPPALQLLSLAGNQISAVDLAEHYEPSHQLQTLLLQSNNLYALPDCLSRLGSLTHLDVSANQLVRPSAGVGALSRLLEINLCDNSLQMLPSDLGLLLGSLQTLRIAGNPLSLLPPALIEPDASDDLLRYLLLCEQSISTLSLDISRRSLGHIPGHVFDMLHLRVLNVADNGLTILPDAIGRLNELTDLIIDDNQIVALPLGFGECHRLTRLSSLRMTLTSPPESILSRGVQVTREWIKRLCDASSSELSAGAEDDGLRLDLSSLALDGWPQELQSDAFSSLVRLSLIDNLLPEIPETIEFLSGLRSLQAGYNRCESLPTQMGTLTNLTSLSVPFNLLADIPASIAHAASLTDVNLDGNKFTVFPAVLCDCHRLKVLRLNQNQIDEINAAVGLLANLEDFQMSYNALHSIPPRISFCTALTRLRLSYNDIQHVPPELGECVMMQELHLTHNKLTTLPPTIGRMSSLRELQVAANFFKSPLSQIVQRGGGATMRYLREVLAGGVPVLRPLGAEDPFADPDAASGKKQVVQTRYSSLNAKK